MITQKSCVRLVALGWCLFSLGAAGTDVLGQAQPLQRPPLVFKVQAANERVEMTVNTSRIFTMDQRIPQAQVDNPELLELTPLSPKEIQVSAKAAGVTRVTLWGEDKKIYTVDVLIFGDAQQLTMLLRSQFPNASLKVIPVSNGVLISGYVDQPEHVGVIKQIALEFYPKVIDNITVSGIQQVLLHVKIMEVSRSKLRRLGFDFAKVTGSNVVASGISGLLTSVTGTAVTASGRQTFAFSIVDGTSAFFGLLEALREDKLAKILAEPTLVAVSGRPAYFEVGGEFVYIKAVDNNGIPQVDWKKYGTRLDFVPIVLGQDRIRLEVRPRVSEIDQTHSVNGTPSLKERSADTGVEMKAGETLALAGLVQSRIEGTNRGLPWISEVPYLGAAFRKVDQQINEVELLILVTPELVDAMAASQVPPCGPGTMTAPPNDWELYLKGYLEVPNCCPAGDGGGSQCLKNGDRLMPTPTPDGMIGPVEAMPSPPSGAGARRTPQPAIRVAGNAPARRAAAPAGPARAASAGAAWAAGPAGPNAPQNRHTPTRPKVSLSISQPHAEAPEPGFVGPVGYDLK